MLRGRCEDHGLNTPVPEDAMGRTTNETDPLRDLSEALSEFLHASQGVVETSVIQEVLKALCLPAPSDPPAKIRECDKEAITKLRNARLKWELAKGIQIHYVGVAHWARGTQPSYFQLRDVGKAGILTETWKKLRHQHEGRFPDSVLNDLAAGHTVLSVEGLISGIEACLWSRTVREVNRHKIQRNFADKRFQDTRTAISDLLSRVTPKQERDTVSDHSEQISRLASDIKNGLLESADLRRVAREFSADLKAQQYGNPSSEEVALNVLAVVFSIFPAIDVDCLYCFPCRFPAELVGHRFLTLGTSKALDEQEISHFRELALHLVHLPVVWQRLGTGAYRELSEKFRPLVESAGSDIWQKLPESNTDDSREALWRSCFQKLLDRFGEPALGNDAPPKYTPSASTQKCHDDFIGIRTPGFKLHWIMANYWSPWGHRIVSANINPIKKLSPAVLRPRASDDDATSRWKKAWALFLDLTKGIEDAKCTTIAQFIVDRHKVVDGRKEAKEVPPQVEWRIGFEDVWGTVCHALTQSQPAAARDMPGIAAQAAGDFRRISDAMAPHAFSFAEVPKKIITDLYSIAPDGECLGSWLVKTYLANESTTTRYASNKLRAFWEAFAESPESELILFTRYLTAYIQHCYYNGSPAPADGPALDRLARYQLFAHVCLSADWLLDSEGNCLLQIDPIYYRHCLYLLPIWTKELSVLTVVSRTVLEPVEYYYLRVMADKLFTMAWIYDSDWKHTEEQQKILRSAIIGRNMSHNIGSHVLANLSQEECVDSPQDVKMLLSYLEQRMDFIASVLTPWPGWREPVSFFADLLQGFFNQRLLLDYIIRDDGYPASKITMKVRARMKEGQAEEEILWRLPAKPNRDKPEDRAFSRFEAAAPCVMQDFMVGLSGGNAGKQAFYGLLENLLRNSAKHSTGSNDGIQVMLEVEPRNAGRLYKITYSDSLSTATTEVLGIVQRAISSPLVSSDGKPVPKYWGIQEMKVYAQFLLGGLAEQQSGESARLQAVPFEAYADEGKLKFTWYVPMTTLALVIGPPPADDLIASAAGVTFCDFDRSHEVCKAARGISPYIVVFSPAASATKERVDGLCELLKANHRQLPSRILVLAPDDGQMSIIRNKLAGDLLRTRRIVLACDLQFAYPATNVESEWHAFALSYYRLWLDAVLGDGPANLYLFLDRGRDFDGFGNWIDLRIRLNNQLTHTGSLSGLNVHLINNNSSFAEQMELQDNLGKAERDESRRLVFDNHGRIGMRDDDDFYQTVGRGRRAGVNNAAIFDQLSHIPPWPVSGFFLLKLVESSLQNVLIIDDRVAGHLTSIVAESSEAKWNDENKRHEAFFRARISVSFSFHYHDANGSRRSWLIPERGIKKLAREPDDVDAQEGVHVRDGKADEIRIAGRKKLKDNDYWSFRLVKCSEPKYFDVIVVHLGWLETQPALREEISKRKFLRSLEKFAPRVVLTSGRGQTGDPLLRQYPFVSFSTLESCLLRELSKYHLVNALMSATAGESL
jgi:hypothetical protein